MDIENLDEIEEQWGSIEENIILKIESYNDSVNLTKEFLDNLIKQTQLIGKSRRNLEKTLIKEHNQLEVTNNQDYELEQLTLRLKQLENTEASLEEDVSNAESKFNHMEKIESDKLEAYNKVYLKYRDLCKASKVLTRTTFNYQSSNVTGIILNENNGARSFNFKTKKLNAEDVTTSLWKLMGQASGGNWSALVHK